MNHGRGCGLGWWVAPFEGDQPASFDGPGAYGSVSWIDLKRGYGAFVALAQYDDQIAASTGPARIIPELIPIIEGIFDDPG